MADKENKDLFSCDCEACQMMNEYVGVIVDSFEDIIQVIEDKKLAFPDSADEFERVLIILRPMVGILNNVFHNNPGTQVSASSAASALKDIVDSMKQITVTNACVANALAAGLPGMGAPMMMGIGVPGGGEAFEVTGEVKDKIVEIIEDAIQKKKGGDTFH